MSAPVVFGLGIASAAPIYFGVCFLLDTAGRLIRRRRKYAAGYFVRTMDGRLEAGKHISARPLLCTPTTRGRAYLLTLFKEGPNEPRAEERVRNPPFTEPLDDPVEDEEENEDGPLEDSEGKANG